MRFLEPIMKVSYRLYGAVMIVIGLGIIVLAFMNSPIQLQITLGLIGFGFITFGLVQVKRWQDRNENGEKFGIIVTKLDEIQEEIKREDKSKGTGAAIADVITSGLKYYAEHMTKQEKEEQ